MAKAPPTKSSQPKPDPELDFEHAVEQVEQIIERIESGEVGLERSIAEYERGVQLLKKCRETLARAEQRVQDLTAQMNADLGVAKSSRRASAAGPDEDATEREVQR